jgi:hypothetical protein
MMLFLLLPSCLPLPHRHRNSAAPGSFLLSRSTLLNLEPVRIVGEIRGELTVSYARANLTIVASHFIFCREASGDSSREGGALEARDCAVAIADSEFHLCAADVGGGASFVDSAVSIADTNFSQNHAEDAAGAVSFDGGTAAVARGFVFGNGALCVGAFSFTAAAGTVAHAVFLLNAAHRAEAGGVTVRYLPVDFEAGAFIHNHAEGGWAGAATIYDIVGNITFDRTQFVSNEVVGWRDTHVFVRGPKTTAVFAACTFDNPDRAEAVLLEQLGGRTPALDMAGSLFGARVSHVYEELLENESAEFALSFREAWSGGFALVVIVVALVFAAIVAAVLTC